MKIFVNTLVFNEESFLYFALKSVIDYVDKVLIWDTGSKDNTVRVIEELKKKYPRKIEFKEIGEVDAEGVTKARQRMLEESTDCDYIILVDGDEIWPEESIKKLRDLINKEGKNLEGIVVPFYNLVGDIFHYQSEEAGQYELLGKKGHLQIRAINRKIKGLHIKEEYPLEGFYNKEGVVLQDSKKLKFLNAPYLHATHLKRSRFDRKYNKQKLEIGNKFPKDFKFPKVLFESYPPFIPNPFKTLDGASLLLSYIFTPLRKVKRLLKI